MPEHNAALVKYDGHSAADAYRQIIKSLNSSQRDRLKKNFKLHERSKDYDNFRTVVHGAAEVFAELIRSSGKTEILTHEYQRQATLIWLEFYLSNVGRLDIADAKVEHHIVQPFIHRLIMVKETQAWLGHHLVEVPFPDEMKSGSELGEWWGLQDEDEEECEGEFGDHCDYDPDRAKERKRRNAQGFYDNWLH